MSVESVFSKIYYCSECDGMTPLPKRHFCQWKVDERHLRMLRSKIGRLEQKLAIAINALEWNAYTICLDDVYKHEHNEQNKINLLRNIREALDALEKIKALP